MKCLLVTVIFLLISCSSIKENEGSSDVIKQEDTISKPIFPSKEKEASNDELKTDTIQKANNKLQKEYKIEDLQGFWFGADEPVARFVIEGDSIFFGHSMSGPHLTKIKGNVLISYLPSYELKVKIKLVQGDTMIIDSYGDDEILTRKK